MACFIILRGPMGAGKSKVGEYLAKALGYVVVHELCHVHIPNHSSKYWRLVGSIMSDFKRRRSISYIQYIIFRSISYIQYIIFVSFLSWLRLSQVRSFGIALKR